jgi:cytochrome c oxidase cbb3-type subunit 3/ubiquinol-cytochrome c reductase cytochrome c subunit
MFLVACNGGAPQASVPATGSQPSALDGTQARGQELYLRMCKVCHGADGEGYKADNAPMLASAEFLTSVTDAQLREAIAQGRAGTPMSAWSVERGGPLAPQDVTAVIAFLRTWQKGPAVALDERPVLGNATRGAVIYTRECVKCHGARGATGPKVRIGDRELLRHASNGFLRHAISKGRAGTQMPGFETKIDKHGVEDLLAYLRGLDNAPAPPPPMASPRPSAPPIPLGPVPLNPKGPEPEGFKVNPGMTSAALVASELKRGARMAILDARAPSDYTSQHIKGADSVPYYDPDPYFDTLPKDAWLVCYCACPHAESGELATKLQAAGFQKVTILDEGIGTWKANGNPVSAGTEP